MTNLQDLVHILERARDTQLGPKIRERMTDEEVKKALQDAVEWILGKNRKLQEVAGLQLEIERLEAAFVVVAHEPANLTALSAAIRKEYEEKLRRLGDLLADTGVVQDIDNLRTLRDNIKRFGGSRQA